MVQSLKKMQIFFFSLISLPLSFVGIPIYLNISDFYARTFELNLALVGLLLILIRALDAIQDPFVGHISDLLSRKKINHKKIVTVSSLLLCVAFYLVFNPPVYLNHNLAILWFALTLTLTYTCFNFVVINFESLAAIFARNDQERISINSTKELLGLIGMILAFMLPTVFMNIPSLDPKKIYLFLSLTFTALICAAVLVFNMKTNFLEYDSANSSDTKLKFYNVLGDKKFLIFLGIFFINSISVSLPAANLNFYVRDILFAEDKIGWFLSIYFICACLFIPIWKIFANRFGMIKIWIFSIVGSVITFSFSYFLDQTSANYFYVVCLLSGLFLGPDLIMPPAILAKITYGKKEIISSYFSLWNMINKFGLMIAASGSLIILGLAGYHPKEVASDGTKLLPFFYAALPCLLKILVIVLLLKKKFFETNYEN